MRSQLRSVIPAPLIAAKPLSKVATLNPLVDAKAAK